MSSGKSVLSSKIHGLKKVLKPVFKLLHKKRRQQEAVEENTKTPSQNPAAEAGTIEIDENAANEALEARLRGDIVAAAAGSGYVKMEIKGVVTLFPVQGHFPVPVHFGTFWSVPDSDICCRDGDVLTCSQTAQQQVPVPSCGKTIQDW